MYRELHQHILHFSKYLYKTQDISTDIILFNQCHDENKEFHMTFLFFILREYLPTSEFRL